MCPRGWERERTWERDPDAVRASLWETDCSGGVRKEYLEACGCEVCVRPCLPLPPHTPRTILGCSHRPQFSKQSTHPKKVCSVPKEKDLLLCLVLEVRVGAWGCLGCPSPSPHSRASSQHLLRDGGVEHPQFLLHHFPSPSLNTMERAAEHPWAGDDVTNAWRRLGSSRFLCHHDRLHHSPLPRVILNLRSPRF